MLVQILLTLTVKQKANQFTSNTSPAISLASSGHTALPEVVLTVEAWHISLSWPPWSLPLSAGVGRGRVGRTLLLY